MPKDKAQPVDYKSELGQIPDNQIAEKYELTRERVGQVRKKLGIAQAPRSTWRRNHRQRVWDKIEKLLKLGKYYDKDIALLIGSSKTTIFRVRTRLGYPALKKPGRPRIKIPESELGKVPDTVLAKKYGCTSAIVGRRRWTAGIPPCPKRKNF